MSNFYQQSLPSLRKGIHTLHSILFIIVCAFLTYIDAYSCAWLGTIDSRRGRFGGGMGLAQEWRTIHRAMLGCALNCCLLLLLVVLLLLSLQLYKLISRQKRADCFSKPLVWSWAWLQWKPVWYIRQQTEWKDKETTGQHYRSMAIDGGYHLLLL